MCLLSDSSTFQTHKIYIQNLSHGADDALTERILCEFFGRFGEVVDVKLLRNSALTSA